jgi:hypothetical protein
MAFVLQGSSYWVIEGLRFEGRNYTADGPTFGVDNSHDIILRRLLGAKSNRAGNYHLVEISDDHDILIEECELYEFHRHAFINIRSYNITYRRNYTHSRNTRNIPAYPGGVEGRGDAAFANYPGKNNLFENNIGENTVHTFTSAKLGSCRLR